MEVTLERTEAANQKQTLDQIDWDLETAKLQCSLEHPESCEMCQG